MNRDNQLSRPQNGPNTRIQSGRPGLMRAIRGWLCHCSLDPRKASEGVARLVDRREPFAALLVCEKAQADQPQNVHAYLFAIHLALRCHGRRRRAEESFARGMRALTDARDRDLLVDYFSFAARKLRGD